MLSSLVGFLLGTIKNLIWVSYSAVEALLFMWVFNYLAPKFVDWGWNFLPVEHINYWTSLCLFLAVAFLGGWIKKLTPSIVKVKNQAENKK